jgi:predicted regulator of Ras-like GTPase activity (Roadblock/LC7/MglB family)/Tfp pilus assembly protein PilF
MRTPAQADVQRWSDDVARDPKSLAFLPLARAYRRQGLRDTAMQLCLRGLEAYPSHVEAHGLLALLYVERGEHEKAADEWSFVLRIDPDNFEALRGLGFCYLQQDRLSRARQMLERAALLRPTDPAVDEALRMLGARTTAPAVEHAEAAQAERTAEGREPTSDGSTETDATAGPPAPARATARADGPATGRTETGSPESAGRAVGVRWHDDTPFEPTLPAPADSVGDTAARESRPPVPAAARPGDAGVFTYSTMADPISLFEDLVGSGPVLGALVVDPQGLVLAGRMTDEDSDAAVLGAVLGGAALEAARMAAHLSLGEWRGIMMEAENALLHLVPAGPNGMVVLAARRGTPAGWMRRAAMQAADRAQLYMEAYG